MVSFKKNNFVYLSHKNLNTTKQNNIMKFNEILSIANMPGLYAYLAQGKSGIIVEALTDNRRTVVSSTARVSALSDIAIYTEGEDMPLSEVFQTMSDMLEGKEAISHKSSANELATAFATYIPSYDTDRVRASDIKKVFAWYNLLITNGMTEFVSAEDENEEEVIEETAE